MFAHDEIDRLSATVHRTIGNASHLAGLVREFARGPGQFDEHSAMATAGAFLAALGAGLGELAGSGPVLRHHFMGLHPQRPRRATSWHETAVVAAQRLYFAVLSAGDRLTAIERETSLLAGEDCRAADLRFLQGHWLAIVNYLAAVRLDFDGAELQARIEEERAIAKDRLQSPGDAAGDGEVSEKDRGQDGGQPDQVTREQAQLLALMGPEDARVAEIANDKTLTANGKMRKIALLDQRHVGNTAERWGVLLGVTSAAIRKTDFWKEIQLAQRKDD